MKATTLTKWQAYPAYKDSGVEWLGEIPEHWEVKRLKYITTCLDGKRIPLNSEQRSLMQGDYPYWGANGIVDYIDRWIFDEELILLGEDGAPFFDSTKDVAFSVSGKIWVNNHIHVLIPGQSINPKFLTYSLNAVSYRFFIDGSTRDKLTQSDMNEIPIQCLPFSEQYAIADFLDRKTSEIDALIAKKEGLIELLQEKRTALISHAVTKGIDSTVKMKDSGVGWLGEIPEHWNLRKLKFVSKVEISYVDKKSFEHEIEVFLCNYIDVYRNDFITKEIHFMKATATNDEITRNSIKKGDIIVTKDSETPNDIANPALVTDNFENVICGYHLAHIKPNQKFILGNYLLRLFQNKCFNGQFTVAANGITRFGLNSYSILNAFVSIPPIEEQKQITKYLDRETAKTDALISKSREGIDKLKEYRTALISAAATGKIDVRDYQSGE